MKEYNGFHENNFDLLRLVAALQVLFLHHAAFFTYNKGASYGMIERVIWNFPGVNIFFIISGYLIFQSLDRNSLSVFAKKRIKRIFPALVICFLFTVMLLFSVNSLNIKDILNLDFVKWVLAQLTIFQFYNPDIVRDFGFGPPNGALWTISVEIQFYLLVAGLWRWFLMKKNIKTQNLILIIFFVISALYNYLFNNYMPSNSLAYKLSFVFVFSYLYFFITGIFIYVNRHFFIARLRGKALNWILMFIAVCFLLEHFQLRYYRYIFNGLSLVMLILLTGLVFSIAYTSPRLSSKILSGNDISYGIYIYQMPIVNLFFHLNFNTEPYQFLLSLSICIAMGAMSWFLIEKRILKR